MRTKYAYNIIHHFLLNLLTNTHKRRIIYNRRREKMKRRDLIKLLEKNGWEFRRCGGNHDVYTKGKEAEAIPRHAEINENLAKAIIKRRNLK
jgi:mRNA interferase HicA